MRHKFATSLPLLALLSLYVIISFQLPFFAIPSVKAQTDLIINGTNHIIDMVQNVSGNVIVEQNGILILDHATLNETAPSGFNITIRDNGQLILESGSTITTQNPMTLFVRNNGTLTVKDNSFVTINKIDIQTTQSPLIQDSTVSTSNFTSTSQNFTVRNSKIDVNGVLFSSFTASSTLNLVIADSSIHTSAQSSSLTLNSSTTSVSNCAIGTATHAIVSGFASIALYASSTLTLNETDVSIHNSSSIPVTLTLTMVAPVINMQDSHLDLPLILGGSSTANLVNVTMPSTPKATGSSKITTYWWLTTTSIDNANLALPDSTVRAYFNYPYNQSLANTGVTNQLGEVKLQLLDSIYTSTSTTVLHNYQVNATFQGYSSGSATSLPQSLSTNLLFTVKLPILSPSTITLQAATQIAYGSPLTLTGNIHPAQSATITIGIRPLWTNTFTFQNVTSNSNGNFSLTYNATVLGNFEALAYWNGSFPAYHGNQSSLLLFSVGKITSVLTVTLSSNSVEIIPFLGSVTISGSITPARPNVNLTVQYSLDGVNWKLIAYTLTDSAGAYSIQWHAPSAGSYMIRVQAPEGEYYQATTSQTPTLTVNYISTTTAIYTLVAIIVLAAILVYTRRGRGFI